MAGDFNYSYWEKRHFFEADVIIIGAGMVGLTAAIHLKEMAPKLSIIILERGFLPNGASTKNAGFACFGSISELIEQEKICGTNGLRQLIAKRWNGLQKLRKIVGDANMAFNNNGGYELFKKNESHLAQTCVAKISHYNYLIADIVGSTTTYRSSNEKIADFGFENVETLIVNDLESQLNPAKMMDALITRAASLGVKILNNCIVEDFNNDGQLNLKTDKGMFNCRRLLVTTNAFAKQLLPNVPLVPGRGQVIVTSAIPNLKLKGTFHYDKGYYYFRNIDGRILLGGGRNLDFGAEQTTNFGLTDLVQKALLDLLDEVILPNTKFEIEYQWSGIMAFGNSLNPIIEEVGSDVFSALRCNGMGIAIGSQTGEDAADLIFNSL